MLAALYAAIAGLADVLGGLLVVSGARRNRALLSLLAAFGAGFMLAVAMIEMLPGALAVDHGLTALLVGYLAVHFTQHTMTPHFHFGEETHEEEMVSRRVGMWALAGLLPHSFFDGVAISSGFIESPQLGFLVFGSVLLHKVPTGVSLASVMLASGNSVRDALIGVLTLAVATVLGAAITPTIGILANYGIALAAGVTIYVAASNLIPESQHERGWFVPGGVFLGVLAFYVLRYFLPV